MNTSQNHNYINKRKHKKRCNDVPLAQKDTCMPNDIRICKKCSEYY